MSNGLDLSRRQLLAGVAAAGSVGALAGGVTGAALGDTERFPNNEFVAGSLNLHAAWTGPGAGPDNGHQFALDIGSLSPGDSGHAMLTLNLPTDGELSNNPGTVWFRSTCPTPTTILDDLLMVTVSYVDCQSGTPLASIRGPESLRDFANAVRNGYQLSPPTGGTGTNSDCLPVDQPLCIRIDYTLDPGYIGDESTAVTFEVVATQCRHDAGVTNPFVGRERAPCPEPECLCCERVGKLELDADNQGVEDNYVPVGTYDFTESCNGLTGYQIDVIDTVEKSDGDDIETVAIDFRVLDHTGGPVELCEAVIVAGPPNNQRSAVYEVEGATTGLLPAPKKDAGAGPVTTDPDGYYGISHITPFICTTTAPGDCNSGGCE